MLIAAALIELSLPGAESLKVRRGVARAVKDRLRSRFNVAVSEIDGGEERQRIALGCVTVGSDPRHLRERLEKAIRHVDALGLAELVSEDVVVVSIDELEEVGEDAGDDLPGSWSAE